MLILPEKFRAILPTLQFGKRQLIFILSTVVILGLTSTLLYERFEPQIVAKVGSEEITFETVKKMAKECNTDQKEAVEFLVDEKVLSLWATDEGVVISPQEQSDEEIRIRGIDPPGPCTILKAKINLLREKLYQNLVKFREGKLIVVDFGRYQPNPFYQEIKDEGERERLNKEERAYADQLIQSVYLDLKANKLSFDEAIEKVRNDKRVGAKSWYSTDIQSGSFSATDYTEKRGLLNSDLVREKIDNLLVAHFSEPFIHQASSGLGAEKESFVDARWIIAKVDRIGTGYSGSAEELLKDTRVKYNAKIYI